LGARTFRIVLFIVCLVSGALAARIHIGVPGNPARRRNWRRGVRRGLLGREGGAARCARGAPGSRLWGPGGSSRCGLGARGFWTRFSSDAPVGRFGHGHGLPGRFCRSPGNPRLSERGRHRWSRILDEPEDPGYLRHHRRPHRRHGGAGFHRGPSGRGQFVLNEVQGVADSTDPLKRARGRRGLGSSRGSRGSKGWRCESPSTTSPG